MNYKESLEFIHSIPKFVRPLGNTNLNKLLKALKNPQKSLKFIHIAGTNGKGSCGAMTASVLEKAGYKTGLYTSPFIEVFNERIKINDKMIDNEILATLTEHIKNVMEENEAFVSEFAFITALAFVYFSMEKCDFVVLEAGMGGRLDATNVIDESVVSVLMSISLDHTQFLGDTIEKIAFEKCGIIKNNGSVVSYPNDTVRDIIACECEKKNAELIFAKKPALLQDGFIYNNTEYKLSLKGSYQPYNAAVVLEIIDIMRKKGITVGDNAVKKGLAEVSWPARFEYITKNIIIDGGHNPDGINELKKSLASINKKIILVIAMMQDKSYKECIENISSISDFVIATQLNTERSLKAEIIGDILKKIGTPYLIEKDVSSALKKAVELLHDDEVVCICGSLYLAGESRRILRNSDTIV